MSSSKIRSDNHSHQIVFWSILICLFLLRIPFMAGIRLFYGFNDTGNDWVNIVWQLGTYLFTAFLVWWERDDLQNYHIDFLAVIIIILSLPLQTLVLNSWGWGNFYGNVLAFPRWGSLLAWAISIGLLTTLWLSHATIPRFRLISVGWFIIGILLGVFWNLLSGVNLSVPIRQLTNYQSWVAILNPIAVRFLYHLGASSVMEEPLFRGFLWGGLRKAGWKDFWIWLFQAVLFDLSHIYYWKVFPTSLLTVFLSGLFFGFLAWRSKSISMSIAAHSIVNAFW